MYSKKFAIGTINLLRKCNFSLYTGQKSGETIKVKTYNVSFGILHTFVKKTDIYNLYIWKQQCIQSAKYKDTSYHFSAF